MPKQPCALCNKQYKTRAVRCRQCGRRVCKNCSSFGWCLECDDKAATLITKKELDERYWREEIQRDRAGKVETR